MGHHRRLPQHRDRTPEQRLRLKAAAAWLLLAGSACAAAPAPSLPVTGMVAHPGPIALASLPQTTVNASFTAMGGNQSHHWTGPKLLDVLAAAGITDAPGKKTHFRHVILATGKDGYEVAISIGEIDPMTEGKTVIVALQQDGAPLPAPRLIVPGDTHFARGVRDLTGLEVR